MQDIWVRKSVRTNTGTKEGDVYRLLNDDMIHTNAGCYRVTVNGTFLGEIATAAGTRIPYRLAAKRVIFNFRLPREV